VASTEDTESEGGVRLSAAGTSRKSVDLGMNALTLDDNISNGVSLTTNGFQVVNPHRRVRAWEAYANVSPGKTAPAKYQGSLRTDTDTDDDGNGTDTTEKAVEAKESKWTSPYSDNEGDEDDDYDARTNTTMRSYKRGIPFTGYDPQGHPNPRHRAPSTQSGYTDRTMRNPAPEPYTPPVSQLHLY
jgi:hypothetical protein